jgi:futalosine hydrolase
MEGAAFFHAMLSAGFPFLEFRGISNMVETRNRAAWKIPEAVHAVQSQIIRFISSL